MDAAVSSVTLVAVLTALIFATSTAPDAPAPWTVTVLPLSPPLPLTKLPPDQVKVVVPELIEPAPLTITVLPFAPHAAALTL